MAHEMHVAHNIKGSVGGENRLLLVFATVVLIADQAAKHLVVVMLDNGRVVKAFGGLVQLDFTANTGAAFGLLRSAGLVFVAIALAVAGGILVQRKKIALMPWPVRVALGMVLGGALSNALDRIRLGYVVDFIDLRWWPVFNLADSAIVVGAVLLTLHSFWTQRSDHAV